MNYNSLFFVGLLLCYLFVSNNLIMLQGTFLTLLMCGISFAILPTTRKDCNTFILLTGVAGILILLK